MSDTARPKGERAARLAALSASLAPGTFVLFLAVATVFAPGYSHRSETISRLAAAGIPHSWIMAAGFIAYGVLVLPLGYGLYAHFWRRQGDWHRGRLWARALLLALAVYGISGILAGLFAVDGSPQGQPASASGWIHAIAARGAFVSIVASIFLFARLVPAGASGAWRGFKGFSLALGVATVAFVALFEAEVWPDSAGVVQRGSFVTTLLWVQLVSVRLFVVTGRAERGA